MDDIIYDYENHNLSIRQIAKKYNLTFYKTRKILDGNVEFRKRLGSKHSDETKNTISQIQKDQYSKGERIAWMTGKRWGKMTIMKQMKSHLDYDVSLEWLCKFEDVDKLKFISRSFLKSVGRSTDKTYKITTEEYVQFIEKFYEDEHFNYLYGEWKKTGNKWIKPSLDHVIPKSMGGPSNINNYKYVSWLENRAKCDMTNDEWVSVKNNIEYYLR